MSLGDYVRNENGLIGKIIGFKGDMVETDNKRLITYKSNYSECKIKENIIDLIEVGDYVNGCYVDEVFEYEDDTKGITICDASHSVIFNDKKIKSIVTKEQFEEISYKIGEQ